MMNRVSVKWLRVCGLLAAPVLVGGVVMGAGESKANLQVTMLTKVNPNALAFWDITNKSQDDTGGVDTKKIDAASWGQLLEIGRALEEGGRLLAVSPGVLAAAPGAKLQDESNQGASKAADVQRYLDAKPAEFRRHALQLQKTGTGIVAAVTQRDGKRLGELSGALDEVCESCHVVFWYPQQKNGK